MNRLVRLAIEQRLAMRQEEAEDEVSKLIASPLYVVGRPVTETDKTAGTVAQTMAQNA